MQRSVSLLLAFWLLCLPLFGQRRDSVYTASEQFKVTKLIAPAVLVTAGTAATLSPWYQAHVNQPIRSWSIGVGGAAQYPFENIVQYAPAVGYGIAALCGAGKHSLWEQALTGVTGMVLMAATVNIIKFVGVERPNGVNTRSFPSGHTATAFAGAELVRLEYGPWWGLAAYSVAALTGFMRVYHNWHWTSDVLAGAGIGILCANAAYWLLPLERKLLGLDSKMVNGQHYRFHALPYAASTPCGSAFGLSLAYTW